MAIARIGLDIAKLVFQVHGVDGHGKAVLKKTLSRSEMLNYLAGLPDRHRSLRRGALLGQRAWQARARRTSDGSAVRQPVPQKRQERCQ